MHKGQLLHDHYRHHARITTSYAPHAPYTVADNTLNAIMTNAEELDVTIHMHIHETSDEISQSIENYGMRPLARLKEIGLLSPRLSAVHMTQLTDEEITWCSDTGVNVIHCPGSNLKLATGFTPISALNTIGVNISIGTDGAASNNALDMFSEIKQTALLAKAVAQDASSVPAHTALEMATINAAKALGLDHMIGSIEVGKMADMIAVNFDEIETQPCYDTISQLVYATGRDKVTDVWVAGRQLMKERQLTTMNTTKIIKDVQHWGNKIRPKNS